MVKWCKRSLGKIQRENGGCKQTCNCSFSSHLPFPLKCLLSVLVEEVFQEQTGRSKPAVTAAGLKKQHVSLFGVHLCIARQGHEAQATMCHTVSCFLNRIWEHDRQMSHSVKSYWFTAGWEDRASNCQFHARTKWAVNDGWCFTKVRGTVKPIWEKGIKYGQMTEIVAFVLMQRTTLFPPSKDTHQPPED